MKFRESSARRRSTSLSATIALLATIGVISSTPAAHAANCMAAASGLTNLNCTANDFSVSSISVTNVIHACEFVGDTFTFDGTVNISSGHANRFDVGIYIGADGSDALSGGNCDVYDLPIPPAPNLESSQDPADTCGDYDGNADSVPVFGVSVLCTDSNGNGTFDMNVCTSWDVNKNHTCTGPSEALPSAGSKCQCQQVETDQSVPTCAVNSDCASDGNPCTNEVCLGHGAPGADIFGCGSTPNTGSCDDGNFCTVGDTCTNGDCVGTANPCNDNNDCTTDSCNPDLQACSNAARTGSCDDGNFCTVGDTCLDGACRGAPNSCDDNNDCTTDSCDTELQACSNVARSGSCDDGNFCTINDSCTDGSCVGDANTCDDSNPCTADSCNVELQVCSNIATTGSCDDGNFCTVGDTCVDGACRGAPNSCNDNNDCTTDSCDTELQACSNLATTGSCDDGNFCTVGDTCLDGACRGTPNTCDDNNDCTTDSCDGELQQCSHVAHGGSCDDGNFCTVGDTCSDGRCVGAPNTCDDGNTCTNDSCDSEGQACAHTNNTNSCDDGLFCDGASDFCSGGVCTGNGNPCPGPDGDSNCAESCNEELHDCSAADPNGSPCDDGLFCDGSDTCQEGSCSSHAGNPCAGNGGQCQNQACDEESSSCATGNAPDNTPCDDNNDCTRNDVCTDGACAGTSTLLVDFCPWTVVNREGTKADLIKMKNQVAIAGDICGGILKLGSTVAIEDDAVSGMTSYAKAIRLANSATVGNDIVSAGGGAKALPGTNKLPYTTPKLSLLAPGSTTAKDDASGSYDLSGTNPQGTACIAVREDYQTVAGELDAMTATQSVGKTKIKGGQTFTVTPNVVGGLNVVNVAGYLKASKSATLELSGGGDPDTVVVLRIAGKFLMQIQSQLTLTNSLTANHTLIYVKGKKAGFSDSVTGAGTVFCMPGKLKTKNHVEWNGALFGAGKRLKIGSNSLIDHTSFNGF